MKFEPVIVSRKVEDLIPYARNSRTHSDAQVAQVAASIREFGWTNPVLIDGENGVIAGHCRALPPGLHPWLVAEAEHDLEFYDQLCNDATHSIATNASAISATA